MGGHGGADYHLMRNWVDAVSNKDWSHIGTTARDTLVGVAAFAAARARPARRAATNCTLWCSGRPFSHALVVVVGVSRLRRGPLVTLGHIDGARCCRTCCFLQHTTTTSPATTMCMHCCPSLTTPTPPGPGRLRTCLSLQPRRPG